MTALDVPARCATKRVVQFRWLTLVALVAPATACTVLNDLDGYSGGKRDTGVIVDTGAVDTAVPDTAKPVEDTSAPDTATADSGAADTASADSVATETMTVDSAMDTSADATDGGACVLADFGLSEFQVRGTFGSGDKREWIELTNYGTSLLDVSGVTVKIFSGTEKASLTFPAGTTVAAGAAVVIVGDKAVFSADVTAITLGAVFEFAKNDYLVNSSSSEVRIFAPGCASASETAVIPSKMYSIGQSWAYPAPTAACPASARLMAGGTLGTAWKEVPVTTTSYGSYTGDAGTQALYGTPTKPNNVACP